MLGSVSLPIYKLNFTAEQAQGIGYATDSSHEASAKANDVIYLNRFKSLVDASVPRVRKKTTLKKQTGHMMSSDVDFKFDLFCKLLEIVIHVCNIREILMRILLLAISVLFRP